MNRYKTFVDAKERNGRFAWRGTPRFEKIVLALLIALFMILSSVPGIQAQGEAQSITVERSVGAEPGEQNLRQMLSIAEAQHEIAKLLISQGRFDRILPEIRKIFELKLPDKYESAVAQSASLIANLLVESKQFALSHQVLDEAQRRMKLNENKASLLKIEAYVYKTEGNLEKALQLLERAVELEKQRHLP